MAWHRRWVGVSLIGLSGWLLTGCASGLPDWAQSQHSYAEEISLKAAPVVRLQTPDGPAVTLKQPLPPPEPPSKPLIAAPIAIQPDAGIEPVSYANRGKVRVRVRAWVNGRPIFDEEVLQGAGPEMRRVYALPESQRSEKMTELLNAVIDQIVDQELMYQHAVKLIEKNNKHMLEKLRDFVDQEFDKSLQKMRDAKVPEDQIRELEPTARRMLERNLISTEYARNRIKPTLDSIGMRDIREYYETHLNEFMTVDKVVWQDIFIPTSKNLPTVEDAKRFAEELLNKCRTAEQFNQLMVYNEGDSKLRGGEGLGQRLGRKRESGEWEHGDIRPMELDEPLSKLGEGQIGPVVPFSTGVHLIRVTKREYKGQLPLNDQVQKQIRKKLESQLADREYRRIVRELRTRAVVRVERETP
jgi:hypothetical protein